MYVITCERIIMKTEFNKYCAEVKGYRIKLFKTPSNEFGVWNEEKGNWKNPFPYSPYDDLNQSIPVTQELIKKLLD